MFLTIVKLGTIIIYKSCGLCLEWGEKMEDIDSIQHSSGRHTTLNQKELKKAEKERDKWKKKAVFWHNAIPNFDYETRGTLTKDVNLINNVEQLELNKKLYTSVHWNNWINVCVSLLNLALLMYQIFNWK